MNDTDRQARIHHLQNRRHALLQRREQRGAPVASIDMELNVVRSELQALYEVGRLQAPHRATQHGFPLQSRG
ncbi:hypothetical protein [Acidithiobacillus ferrooxidans]|jgi:hypothetical protein|uniref:Uncharacterized protein n=2 Tax=Acidithiobacillus ferrooxidans TaxID=920 RepID=B7J4G1_ACIF2|nr:hypothetical protein [Acidithiobacillus ferrooxidans]EGQ62090.1 hypothetical protein GGI1_10801 [Acidithiobacillus sp. GGI-221]MCL4526838.1 hypothetical protein [Gammaproteobacteria bacterium]ACH82834.1 hypothetical protein Lferr_0580 [Acidithiobacillus ferrooxidans ATCC 53993]ACK78480.1 hypothetical protein AFE_0418 [Acidithiobacillus ferrooxidans ATCC 23270]MBU2775564.1 hypothetical protein [Acidithiobacillus ferrooxidans]